MATLMVSLPEPLKEWVEALVDKAGYASTSDYVRDLVIRDQEDRETPFEITDELRDRLERSRASGVSDKKVGDVFADAVREFEARQAKIG